MSTTYGTASSITIPSDGDTIDAADVNTPLAALWDQHDLIADTTALKAILVPTHGLMRYVRGLGSYVFVTSGTYSAVSAVTPYVLTATDGTAGRWVNSGWFLANQTIVRSFACADGNPRGSTDIAKTHDMSAAFWFPLNADSTGADAGRAYHYFEGRQIKFYDVNNGAATGKHILFHLNQYLVHGANFDSLKLNLKGAGGHAALPLMMPSIALVRFDPEMDTLVSLKSGTATVDDTSATAADYDAVHSITLTPDQNTTISLTKYSYYAVVCNEGNTNAQAELGLRNLIITMTTAGYI